MIGIFDMYSQFHEKETCQRQSGVNKCELHTYMYFVKITSIFGNDNHVYDGNGDMTCLKHAGVN